MHAFQPSLTIIPTLASLNHGDDLGRYLREGANGVDALRAYAALLREDADRISAIAAALTELPAGKVAITAEHHYIGVTLPADVAQRLITAGVARAEITREEADTHEERRRW